MEEAVENLEKQMQKTDQKLDNLAVQVGNIGTEILSDENGEIEVFTLLQSVNDVKTNYQNLRKEISEVQDLQKQLSTSLQTQIRMMQSKFNVLKEKITTNVPQPPTLQYKDLSQLYLESEPSQGNYSDESDTDDQKQFAVQGNY